MAYHKHSITVDRKDAGKADAILNKYWNNYDINHISSSDQNSKDKSTTTYRFELVVSDDLENIKDEFREAGIELF